MPDQPRRLESFSLTNSTGRTVTREELDGKFLAVSFLFTSCSLTCPEVSKRMAEIQHRTATNNDVRLLSLTVDPRSDTPPVLAKWGERFGADTNRWLMLTGGKVQLHQLIGTSFLATETNNPFNSTCREISPAPNASPSWTSMEMSAFFFDGLRSETTAAVFVEIEKLRSEKLFMKVFLSSFIALILVAGCKPESAAPPAASTTNQTSYSVRGVVQFIAPDWRKATIKHEKIPGYMAAMTMDLSVKNTNESGGISSGDEITFHPGSHGG